MAESEGAPKEIGDGHSVIGGGPEKSIRVESEVGEELGAVSYWARLTLGPIFDLLGELFDLLGFLYEGDGEGGACVGMVDLVL